MATLERGADSDFGLATLDLDFEEEEEGVTRCLLGRLETTVIFSSLFVIGLDLSLVSIMAIGLGDLVIFRLRLVTRAFASTVEASGLFAVVEVDLGL